MALKLEKCGENWNVIYSEHPNGEKVLWDVSGSGTEFDMPAGTVEIRKRAFNKVNCPNLQTVRIPEKVRVIHQGAFEGFTSELTIECACQYKPEGYFEGEYIEEHEEDGATYVITHFGSWLHRSVVLRSRDSEGRLTWISTTQEEELARRPIVKWGC